jgi:hypothetical protein
MPLPSSQSAPGMGTTEPTLMLFTFSFPQLGELTKVPDKKRRKGRHEDLLLMFDH